MGRALEVLCSEGKGVSWWERVDGGVDNGNVIHDYPMARLIKDFLH
jgi:hypothetical protein